MQNSLGTAHTLFYATEEGRGVVAVATGEVALEGMERRSCDRDV